MCAFSKKSNRSQKYTTDEREALQRLLDNSSLPRDALPYTTEFSRLKAEYQQQFDQTVTDWEFWRALATIGKRGGRGTNRKRKAPRTPKLSNEEQLEVLRLMPDGIGNRDHLPYTTKFEEMHARFTEHTGIKLTLHEFWRGVSRVAKLSRKPKPIFEEAPVGDLPPELVQFLERTNPWWKAQPAKISKRFRRWAFHEVLRRFKADVAPVVVIRGPRRVGKSTIQEQIVEQLLNIEKIGPERILRVQFDDVPGLGSLRNPVEAIVRWYEKYVLKGTLNTAARKGEITYLLFDELQNVSKWAEQLKALVDHVSAKTFVTGSSALRIARGRDNLAGRMTTIELGPLRLGEIAGIRRLENLPAYKSDLSLEDWKNREFWEGLLVHGRNYTKQRLTAFKYFAELGGYPSCHEKLHADLGILRQQLINEVVVKTIDFDALPRRRTPSVDPRLVRETFRLVCRYAGQHVAHRRLAEEIQQVLQSRVSVDRVDETVQFLVDSMLLHQVPPLEMLLKRHESSPKLCLCDHFVRNAFLQDSIPIWPDDLASANEAVATVAGHLVESSIGYFLKCVPGLDVSWFPKRANEPEVDFVLTIGLQRIPVEVKYKRGEIGMDDIAGLKSFCSREHYGAPFGLVVTQTQEKSPDDRVIFVPASIFLLVC